MLISVRSKCFLAGVCSYKYAHKTLGANPSAEEQEEALEDGATQVNNVVHSFRLQPTTFDKKTYLTYLKVASMPLLPSLRMVLNCMYIPGIHEGSEGKAFK